MLPQVWNVSGPIKKAMVSKSVSSFDSNSSFDGCLFFLGSVPLPSPRLVFHRFALDMFHLHFHIACDISRALLFASRTLSFSRMETSDGTYDMFGWAETELFQQQSRCATSGLSTSQPGVLLRRRWNVAREASTSRTHPRWSAAGGSATNCIFSRRTRTCWLGAPLIRTKCRRVAPNLSAVQVAT